VQSPGRPDVIDLSLSYNEDGLGILVKKQVSFSSGLVFFARARAGKSGKEAGNIPDLVLLPDLEITGEG
jgi:hypothetical protein